MAQQNAKMTNYNGVQLDGITEVVGAETISVLLADQAGLILWATGTTVPTDTTAGYAKGALFIDTNVAGGTGGLYCNKGTTASSAFTLVTQA